MESTRVFITVLKMTDKGLGLHGKGRGGPLLNSKLRILPHSALG